MSQLAIHQDNITDVSLFFTEQGTATQHDARDLPQDLNCILEVIKINTRERTNLKIKLVLSAVTNYNSHLLCVAFTGRDAASDCQ